MLSTILLEYFGTPRLMGKDGLLVVMVNFCSGFRQILDMLSFCLAIGWSFQEEWRSMLAVWHMETNGIR
jgi:hypothetical protein